MKNRYRITFVIAALLVCGSLFSLSVQAEEAPAGVHSAAATSETIEAHGEMTETEEHQAAASHAEEGTHGAVATHDAGAGHGEGHTGDFAEMMHHMAEEMAHNLPLWSGIPFVGILLSIALFPLFAPHFWHHHFPKIAAFWAVLFAVPFLFVYKSLALYEILHIYLLDYIPFIILLWGLFVTSGGVFLRGALVGTPGLNTSLIAIGMILASWMGTTGASMLMIRPLLRANEFRKTRVHIVVFFIFLVSNIGGALTPLGDPPLFLGFLHGVPFFWTFKLSPHFLFTAGVVLLIFYLFDRMKFKQEADRIPTEKVLQEQEWPLRLEGVQNFLFLGGIIALVLVSGTWKPGHFTIYGVHMQYQNVMRDVGIIFMGILSIKFTHKKIREENHFTWFPIQEVAYLFAGIFMCIIPMLAMLKAGSTGAMGFIIEAVNSPRSYFWITGALSSFLDNAPTYLSFFNLALGQIGISEAQAHAILIGELAHPHALDFIADLKAISVGAVFFGAMTYIGNAPNFMVRSIAEENKIPMPSFFGFMMWSVAILVPVFVLVMLIFI
ncbi:sodium:proton antiporter [Calditrichota bacterium]